MGKLRDVIICVSVIYRLAEFSTLGPIVKALLQEFIDGVFLDLSGMGKDDQLADQPQRK